MKQFMVVAAMLLFCNFVFAGPGKKKQPTTNQEQPSAQVIEKIKSEGLDKSQVMDFAFRLTDASGPRVTASPGFNRAAQWAQAKLAGMGLQKSRVEPWGQFGKSWEVKKCYVAMTQPYYAPIIAFPKVWTGSTPVNGTSQEVVLVTAQDSTTFETTYKGKLKGKIVMLEMFDTLKPSFTADADRFHDTILEKMAKAEPIIRDNPDFRMGPDMARRFQRMNLQRRINELVNAEQPALILSMVARGNDGTIFVQGGGSYAPGTADAPASVVISSDEYLRIQRLVKAGIAVKVDAEVLTQSAEKDTKGYNVLAEIPGTDPVLKNEIVMLGAHLDSWQGSTGATDNAAGCAVMMEAVRILIASGVQPKRTIQIALWSGEEQGLLGSRAWVKTNLADPADMLVKPLHEKIAAYFNLDNGTGKIRGIYCQGNKEVMPIFKEWLTPFHNLGAKTVTINNTGGTDHQSFDAVGIPGFQFIQDAIEYDTRTHHTNMDSYDHLVADDLKQAATIVASFAYQAADKSEKLPRKPLPQPRPAAPRF